MTSIEFIEQNFTLNINVYDWLLLIQQAKEMHKAEILAAANTLLYHSTGPGNTAAEQYYQETFKKD
jgi:hypothetical protein